MFSNLTEQQVFLIQVGWVLAALSMAVGLFVHLTNKHHDSRQAKKPD